MNRSGKGRPRTSLRELRELRVAPAKLPSECWRCGAPALTGRAVCSSHAEQLERRSAELRAGRFVRSQPWREELR